jgi:hypothetical protein
MYADHQISIHGGKVFCTDRDSLLMLYANMQPMEGERCFAHLHAIIPHALCS